MTILLSQKAEPTTDMVAKWLTSMNVKFIRVNGEDFSQEEFEHFFSFDVEKKYRFNINGQTFYSDDIDVVWFRRWQPAFQDHFFRHELDFDKVPAGEEVKRHLMKEFQALTSLFTDSLQSAYWINHPDDNRLTKLHVLTKAREIGLNVPDTIVCSLKSDLQAFAEKHNYLVITKSLKDGTMFSDDSMVYQMYTSEVDRTFIDSLDDKFPPSFFQQQIEKKYELRVFYLNGAFYSMAIFSQADKQTAVDFRIYNNTKPNRNIPFKLPEHIEQKLTALMKHYGLSTGSIDIIRGVDGHYYFLEINPVGQFGMVSMPCNYNLEKKMAEYISQLTKTSI